MSARGKPGKDGKDAEGTVGGAGGAGGQGGEGQTTGGVGGQGGEGGDATRGPMGPTGRPGRNSSRLALVGYAILALSVALSLFFIARNTQQIANERSDRSAQLNSYLVSQCFRESQKDAVFVSILKNAQESARRQTTVDQAIRHAYIVRLQRAIDAINSIDFKCVTEIPPPIPKHKN